MITITIDDPDLERIFYEEYNGDKEAFSAFITQSVVANNVDYHSLGGYTPNEIKQFLKEADESGESEMTHKEIFEELRKKYAID